MAKRGLPPVAVTGIGMITPLAPGAPQTWKAMLEGRSGIRRIRRFDTGGLAVRIGGELPDAYYEMEEAEFPRRFRNQTLPPARLAFLCAKEAIEDGRLAEAPYDPYRVAVFTGCSQSPLQEGQEVIQGGAVKYLVVKEMVNAAAAWISVKHGFRGPTCNIAAACASGAFAVAAGLDSIRAGRADAAVVVGADMMLNRQSIQGFAELMALSELNDAPERASRPFDNRRSGFILANGGAALVLESLDTARRRGARVYALLTGAGLVSEAYNIVAPEPTGREIARTMSAALDDAGLSPDAVGYINAHGTSTRQNDACETAGIKRLFAEAAARLAVSSQKSMIGHTIGGAGAIECAATALALRDGVLPPTINYEEPDPDCDLDYVPNAARPAPDLKAALSNSFGFGGHNCALVLEKAP
jgi:3-oxoacyl-[acyl-carrier-protein] synthase II